MVFLGMQTLSYNGYIEVDYAAVSQDMRKYLPTTSEDKDGKKQIGGGVMEGTIDVGVIKDKIMEVLSYNMPAGCGFTSGVVMGLRSA